MMDLSREQRTAVERTGQDVCVVAGPGSGKTRVLTERFAWLVESQGVDPARILAITFTEKAATEIKQRLIARFAASPERREALERVWVSTIDGFCHRLLHEHAIAAGLAPDFSVLEAGLSEQMLRQAAEDALEDLYREDPEPMRQLLEALDLSTHDDTRQPDLAESLVEVYHAMRVSGVEEIPAAADAPALWEEARELASTILRDPTPGTTANTRVAIERLREWAAAFRALSLSPIQKEHLALAAWCGANTGHVGRGPRYEAARRLKNEILPELQATLLGQWYEGLQVLLRTAVRRIASVYAAAKRAEASVDFADLEAFAIRLLESDARIRTEVQARFDHVLMDELQDTNPLQWRLVKLVRPPRMGAFFGVGDLNQSIYGFRHANPELFETYGKSVAEAGGTIDILNDNYRSRPEILAAVSRTFRTVPGVEPRALIAKQQFVPAPSAVVEHVVERMVGQGENAYDVEAALVAARIRELYDSGAYGFDKIAVLLRSLTSLDPFARAFDRFDIPFLVSGGRTFLEARETRDLMGLLTALANPLDEIATVGVLRGPLCGVSDEEIFLLGPEGRQRDFEQRFGNLRRMAGFIAPDLLLARVLDESSYVAALSERARANVDKFLGWIRREYRRRPRPLPELLDALEALRFTQSEAEAAPPEASNAVRVLTIHGAKGLEFPVVFLAALHRKPDSSQPVILFSPERGLGAKWRNPASGKGQSDAVHKALVVERKAREEAEENRLLYVAMTRAEHRLVLSYAERKFPSPYQKLVEGAGIPKSPPPAQTLPPAVAHASACGAGTRAGASEAHPTFPAQYDSSASVTDVAEFAACPRKYYLGRYLGIDPEPKGQGTGAIQTGLLVHRALAGEQVDSPEAMELAGRFRASPLGARATRATRIEREFDFMLPVEDVILSGQIDLWFEEAGELVLVDYKTDREESSAHSYALQLRLYALALELYAGRIPDRAVLYYLRQDRPVGVSLSKPELEAARSTVKELRDAQESLVFPLNPGERCARCVFYRGACPAVIPQLSSSSPPS